MNVKKAACSVILVVCILSLLTVPVFAKASLSVVPTVIPYVAIDCGVTAYDPVRSGSYVKGMGEISCYTSHSSLKVVAGIKDWTNRYTSITKTCYSASACSITAQLSHSSGRQWITDVSGYMGTSWQAYDTSNWVSIP